MHLEAVPIKENRRRRDLALNITHCPQGHPYDEVNTFVNASGHRGCRTCRGERVRAYYAAHPEKRQEAWRRYDQSERRRDSRRAAYAKAREDKGEDTGR
jgi:hypothetical protein